MSSAYIKIREFSPVAREFRASRIPTRRHRRYENTWREGKRQNTPRPPTRARERARTRSDIRARVRTHASRIPMERPMTGMTCTRCRTEDPSRSSPVPPRPSIRSRLSSTVDLLDVRRLGQARSGYLLRGRCGLNLINSMRHLDKCAPRTRIQRIIFILIHLPFPPFPPLSPACLPSLYRSLTSFSGSSSSAISPHGPSPRTLESFLRLSDPRFILVKREHAAKRRGRVGGQKKKGRIYPLPSRRDHLSF